MIGMANLLGSPSIKKMQRKPVKNSDLQFDRALHLGMRLHD